MGELLGSALKPARDRDPRVERLLSQVNPVHAALLLRAVRFTKERPLSDTFVDDDQQHDDDLEIDHPDDSDLLRTLRKQLRAANKKGKRVDELETKVRTLEGERLISTAGLGNLTDRQRQMLLREVGDEITVEKLKEAAVELGWAEAEPDPGEQQIDEHTAISNAGRGAQGKGGSEISPETVSSWDEQRRRDFRKQHPAEWESLKRGETVRGITF